MFIKNIFDVPKNILFRCLDKDPARRWSCEQLLSHSYFKNFSFKLPDSEEEGMGRWAVIGQLAHNTCLWLVHSLNTDLWLVQEERRLQQRRHAAAPPPT